MFSLPLLCPLPKKKQLDSGEKRLVAYVLSAPSSSAPAPDGSATAAAGKTMPRLASAADVEVDVHELRSFCRAHLPDNMVPSVFMPLTAFPYTANGKVDRRALPKPTPDMLEAELACDLTPPNTALEAALAPMWAEVLGLSRVGIFANFFDLGGHSLAATQLIAAIEDRWDVQVSMRTLFEEATVVSLAAAVQTAINYKRVGEAGQDGGGAGVDPAAGDAVPDLAAEAVLPADVKASGPVCPRAPEAVLVTGVTGFVGAFLVAELLATTGLDVYCLVRAETAVRGPQRLVANLRDYDLLDEVRQHDFDTRVTIVVGTLSEARFGLSGGEWEALASQVDLILHCGAMVNFVYPYAAAKAANVGGTIETLRLAVAGGRVRPVYFISTMSTIDTDASTIAETDVFDRYERLVSGYSQSKWVGEQVVLQARARGIPTAVFRLGRITGDSSTGVGNADDLLSRLIRGCVQLGVRPDIDTVVDMTPVDYTCAFVVQFMVWSVAGTGGKGIGARHSVAAAVCKNFHLMNSDPVLLSDLFVFLERHRGLTLRVVPYADWFAALIDHARRSQENVLYPVLSLFARNESGGSVGPTLRDELPSPEVYPTFEYEHSVEFLNTAEGSSLSCPPVADLLGVYFTEEAGW